MTGTAFDLALDRTLAAASPQERLTGLALLTEHLFGVSAPACIVPPADASMPHVPLSLRWFHAHYARFGGQEAQNPLVRLTNLENGPRMVFACENQGVYLWATGGIGPGEPRGSGEAQLGLFSGTSGGVARPLPDQSEWPDPPVWGRYSDKGKAWKRDARCLSEFLVQYVLVEFALTAEEAIREAGVPAENVELIAAALRPVFDPWHWPPNHRLWAGAGGVVVSACPNNPLGDAGGTWQVSAAAVDRGLLEPIKRLLTGE